MIELPGVADKLLAQIRRQPFFMARRPRLRLPNRQQRMKRVWKQLIYCSRSGYGNMAPRCLEPLTTVDVIHLNAIFKQRGMHFYYEGRKGLSRRYNRIREALGLELGRRRKRKAVKEILEETK